MAMRNLLAEKEKIAAEIQLLLKYLEVNARHYRMGDENQNLFNMIQEACGAIKASNYKVALPGVEALMKREARSVLMYKLAGREYEPQIVAARDNLGRLAFWRWCLLNT